MRNWLIGYYIVEFEQKGKERAQYGDKLLKRLEDAVNQKGQTVTLFRNSRRFYRTYPQMVHLLQSGTIYIRHIHPTLSDELQFPDNQAVHKSASLMHKFISAPEDIIGRLSFSHICEIEWIDDPMVRYSYEQECMRCTWSVRELRRQIETNLHIRIGLSKDPE